MAFFGSAIVDRFFSIDLTNDNRAGRLQCWRLGGREEKELVLNERTSYAFPGTWKVRHARLLEFRLKRGSEIFLLVA